MLRSTSRTCATSFSKAALNISISASRDHLIFARIFGFQRSLPAIRCPRFFRCANMSWPGGLASYGNSIPDAYRQIGL
jgi:hypothetical protein